MKKKIDISPPHSNRSEPRKSKSKNTLPKTKMFSPTYRRNFL